MAVVIRLSRQGTKKAPFYRIIASPKGSKRDTKFLEIIGTHNPLTNPTTSILKIDRIKHWLSVGAVPSTVVASIIKRQIPNVLEERAEKQLKRTQAARKKRKTAQAKRAKAK